MMSAGTKNGAAKYSTLADGDTSDVRKTGRLS